MKSFKTLIVFENDISRDDRDEALKAGVELITLK